MTLRVEGLGKRYRSGTWGLRGFSMAPEPGVTAIVGPAGAGKSTLLRMLATATPPTEGMIAWAGIDIRQRPTPYRRALGYLPQHVGAYDGISGRAFLRYIAALKGLSGRGAQGRVDELMDALDLTGAAGQRMGGYSPAARCRVGLAQALLNDPRLLLIDEAGSSLSEGERETLYELIGKAAVGRTAIVTAERAADIAGIATRVGLLYEGHLVSTDAAGARGGSDYCTAKELIRTVDGRVWSVAVDQNAFVELRRCCVFSDVAREEGLVRLRILSLTRPHPRAVSAVPTLADACAYHIHRDAVSGGRDAKARPDGSVAAEGM